MQINPAVSALANVVALIADANPGAVGKVTVTSVTAGNPVVHEPPVGGFNAALEITPVPGQGLNGDPVTINYNRVTLAEGVASPDLDFTVGGNDAGAVTALLAAAAAQLGLLAGSFTIDAGTPLSGVANDGVAVGIDLVPNANSLLYSAGVTIQVSWPVPQEDISTVITVDDMAGFDAAA